MGKGAAIASLLGILFLAGCGGHDTVTHETSDLPSVDVDVSQVSERSYTRLQALPGTVHPVDQAIIASKLMATIEEVDVVIGEQVEAGQTLVQLVANEILAQVEQAEAGLAQLQRNLEREQALLAQNATTAEAVRTYEDQIRLAKARLAEARTMQSYTTIRAPFSGNVTSKAVRRGDLASPGMPLLKIEGLGNLEVHVEVPDSLKQLSIGDKIRVDTDRNSELGTLTELSTAANPASRTRLAKIKLSEQTTLRSGQYVKVLWPANPETILWLPESGLRMAGQLEQVFTVEAGHLQLQLIRTGPKIEDGYQILGGLDAGDTIVLNPTSRMQDGQPATIKQ